MSPDLMFLIFLVWFGIGLGTFFCVFMWRYYDMETIVRGRAPKLAALLAIIVTSLEKLLTKLHGNK
jgi:hypothetical protein